MANPQEKLGELFADLGYPPWIMPDNANREREPVLNGEWKIWLHSSQVTLEKEWKKCEGKQRTEDKKNANKPGWKKLFVPKVEAAPFYLIHLVLQQQCKLPFIIGYQTLQYFKAHPNLIPDFCKDKTVYAYRDAVNERVHNKYPKFAYLECFGMYKLDWVDGHQRSERNGVTLIHKA